MKTKVEKQRDQSVRSCTVRNKRERMPKTLKEIRKERKERAARGEFETPKQEGNVMDTVKNIEEEMRRQAAIDQE